MLAGIHAMKCAKPVPKGGFEVDLIERWGFRKDNGTRHEHGIAFMALTEVDKRSENRCIVLASAQIACNYLFKLSLAQCCFRADAGKLSRSDVRLERAGSLVKRGMHAALGSVSVFDRHHPQRCCKAA